MNSVFINDATNVIKFSQILLYIYTRVAHLQISEWEEGIKEKHEPCTKYSANQ